MGIRGDELEERTRLTRVLVAVVLIAAILSLAAEAFLVTMVDALLWQHVLLVVATLVMAGACGVALRRLGRLGPERAIEITYGATMLAALVTCLVIQQPQAVIGAAIAFFVLTTAPRILPMARTDRWVTIAIVNALGLTGSELLDLPWRIDAGPLLRGPIDVTIVVAIIAFAAVAIRELGRFPLRTKLYLVLLLLAISPLALMITAAQGFFEDHDRDDLAARLEVRASRAIVGWERFLGDQIAAAHELAREPAILAACRGDRAAAGARLEVARRAEEPAVQGIGVVVSGETVARAGVPIAPGSAPISLHAIDPAQGAQIVLRVAVAGAEG
ncbi:MAG: hypothetical protein KC420_12530, partial [Myxococcales bacterium]|nr:hypothetical protein [Myxococcales bacterium]